MPRGTQKNQSRIAGFTINYTALIGWFPQGWPFRNGAHSFMLTQLRKDVHDTAECRILWMEQSKHGQSRANETALWCVRNTQKICSSLEKKWNSKREDRKVIECFFSWSLAGVLQRWQTTPMGITGRNVMEVGSIHSDMKPIWKEV